MNRRDVALPAQMMIGTLIGAWVAALGIPSQAAALAELVVPNVTVDDAQVIPGQQVSISVQVLNVGPSASGSFKTNVLLATADCSFVLALLAQYSVGSLSQFVSDVENLDVVIPAAANPASYSICARADSDSEVPESNENNNLGWQNLTVVECETNAHCEDNDLCNGPNLCQLNECQQGIVFCSDGISCTLDDCIPATGQCTYQPLNSLCDDGVSCTSDSCDVVTDCQHLPLDVVCDDNQFCDGVETCDPVLDCQPGTPPATDDGVDCTLDSCDEANDVIVHAPSQAICEDFLFCTGPSVCDVTLDCINPEPVDCDDAFGCFDGTCNLTSGHCDQAPTPVPPGPALCGDFTPNMEGTWEGLAGAGSCVWGVTANIQHTPGQPAFSGTFVAFDGLCSPTNFSGTLSGESSGGETWLVVNSPDYPEYEEKYFYGSPQGDEFTLWDPESEPPVVPTWIAERTDPDGDADGVSDPTEDAAPNDGDGNDDGIPDSQQASVASLPDGEGNAYVTLEVSGGCSSVTQVEMRTEAEMVPDVVLVEDSAYDYPFGLASYRLPCASATVTLYYHGSERLWPPYRKLGPTNPGGVPLQVEWYSFDAPAAVFGTADIAGSTVATVTLTLVDGALGDDTSVDGEIVDPGGATNAGPPEVPSMGLLSGGIVVLSLIGGAWLRHRRQLPEGPEGVG